MVLLLSWLRRSAVGKARTDFLADGSRHFLSAPGPCYIHSNICATENVFGAVLVPIAGPFKKEYYSRFKEFYELLTGQTTARLDQCSVVHRRRCVVKLSCR